MRAELLYNPLLLLDRLGQWATEKRRLRRLRGTCAAGLQTTHIDSLELLELLRPLQPSVIYDIGANRGTWTLLAKAIYPNARIHAFEPLSIFFNEFRQATKELTGITLHETGLGLYATDAAIKLTNLADASSLLALSEAGKKQWDLRQVEEIPVRIEQLDAWVNSHGLPFPDVIKLDVQGYELEVLKGAERCIAQTKAVLSEVSFMDYYEGQVRFDELVSWMASVGFVVSAFGHGTVVGRALVQTDVLFLRRDMIGIAGAGASRP